MPAITLKSFVQDRWIEGTGAPASLFNPATEQELARTSTAGIDMALAAAFACFLASMARTNLSHFAMPARFSGM